MLELQYLRIIRVTSSSKKGKTFSNFAFAKEAIDYTKLSRSRLTDQHNFVVRSYVYKDLTDINIPNSVYLDYYNSHPRVPRYFKNGRCDYIIMMNISDI